MQDSIQDNAQPLILLGLNEVNFDYVDIYAREGLLPNFQALFDQARIIKTSSEKTHDALEPWIQWVSIQTGKPFSEHGIFRLGDVVERDLTQIWEHLEDKYALTVAAISPMNAANRARDPAFFVPDPWTKTKVTGDWFLRALAGAVANAVNENATGRSKLSTYIYVFLGVLCYSLLSRNIHMVIQILKSLKCHYQRAIFLDQLLTDTFTYHWKKTRPGFSSLFLNGGAHIQHHYLFNARPYDGPHKNPSWYMQEDRDPVLNCLRNYDALIKQILNLPGKPRILIATGLHQMPVEQPIFYWRLKDHSAFLDRIGIQHKEVLPRMSRDFLITCDSADQTTKAEAILRSCTCKDEKALFETIENRGTSLFVSLTYPDDIKDGFSVTYDGGELKDFHEYVAFVAVKNGDHDGEGYLIDSEGLAPTDKPFPITDIFDLIDQHFAHAQKLQNVA